MDDVTVVLGGIIPEADIPALKQEGIRGDFFLTRTSTQDTRAIHPQRLAE